MISTKLVPPRTSLPRTIQFPNKLGFDLLFDDNQFLGIGAVRHDQMQLRSDASPWCVYLESDAGWRFDRFDLVDVQQVQEQVTLVLRGRGTWNPRIQDGDAMGDSRFVAPKLSVPFITIHWHFTPITQRIEENEYDGLEMTLEVQSPGAPVNWLLENSTWELGGHAQGCVLIQQDVSCIDLEQRVEADSAFSTIEAFFSKGPNAWGGSFPMDMLPRAAGAAICDFQTREDYAMCLFTEDPGLSRTRLEKFADENVIHHMERPFFPLTEHAIAPTRTLLVYRQDQKLQQHQWRNLWLDCFTHVRSRMLAIYDFELEVPKPCVHAHLWDDDLKARGSAWSEPLKQILPDLTKAGFKQVFTHGVWESVTSDSKRRSEDGNICCPYAFRFAEQFGGAEGMKRLCENAQDNDIEIFQWYGFQFARFSEIWQEHPEWLLREQHGEPWDGQYGILWCGRMRSPFAQMLEEQIIKTKHEAGVHSMFIDSYQNLGITCVDWQAPDKAPQAREIWQLQSRLQKRGFSFRCEVVTIFGVSQVGMYGFAQDNFRRRLWDDTVRDDSFFAHLDCPPGFHSQNDPYTPGRINPEVYFKLAAHRAIPVMEANPWKNKFPGDQAHEDYARVNRLYNSALPSMHRLRVTSGGHYVLWLDTENRPAVIWAFNDATIASSMIWINLGDQTHATTHEGHVHVKAGNVYRVTKASAD
tara:strand:- start:1251 stop:3338 length:2088 start_codon:yes stop_codon:yes gene_type:complete